MADPATPDGGTGTSGTPQLRPISLTGIPVSVMLQFQNTTFDQMNQLILQPGLLRQSGTSRITLGQQLTRLQSTSTLHLLEQTLPNNGQFAIDFLYRGTVDWAGKNGLRLNGMVGADIWYMPWNTVRFSLETRVNLHLTPMGSPVLSGDATVFGMINIYLDAPSRSFQRRR